MSKILCPLPRKDFDPTETGVPWQVLTEAGHEVEFTTPDGRAGEADPIMLTGKGLGLLKPLLMADANGLNAYHRMQTSISFQNPISYLDINAGSYDALLLPGGHAKGMREYLESNEIMRTVVYFFENQLPVGAICHGTLMAARSISPKTQKSVLYGRKTTGLTYIQEMTAWNLTRLWMNDYYRTYEIAMETELCSYLKSKSDYTRGPIPVLRDSPNNLNAGFTLLDGNYLSARWPGDVHKFSNDFKQLLV